MNSSEPEFRIYVADLHEFTNGRLIGRWITPSDYASGDELQTAITECLTHPTHEAAIHDYEGVKVGEYESAANLIRISEAVDEYGAEKVNKYLELGRTSDLASLRDDIVAVDQGEYDNEESWAQEYIEAAYDLERVLGSLAYYFDHTAFARDAELNGDVTFIELENGRVWVLGR
ncbi:MAG: antirestriction protein ArdA [Deltaproteobacteria bacterium]|nr:antirestriction protein ArdA [Deltaproteobacteria bacterium]